MLMLCPICAGEFEADAAHCLSCGFDLIPSTLNNAGVSKLEAGGMRNMEFVELCRPQTHPEAMFIKETLEQNNVTVMIQGAHSLSVMPYLAFGGQLRVLVAQDQIEYAKELYKAYFESDEETDYIDEY